VRLVFIARNNILARYMLSPVRLSVRLSQGWISRTVEIMITKFSPSKFTSFNLQLMWVSFIQKFYGSLRAGASNKVRVGETRHFLDLNVNISKTSGDPKSLLIVNRKSHMRYRLTSRSMTLDDRDLL